MSKRKEKIKGYENHSPIAQLIHKIKDFFVYNNQRSNALRQSGQPMLTYNWVHILTSRLRFVVDSHFRVNGWLYSIQSFISSYQPDCIRYITDMYFRLHTKIDKIVNDRVAKTDWIEKFKHDDYGGPGVNYPHTQIQVIHEDLEDHEAVYKMWLRELHNELEKMASDEFQHEVARVFIFKHIEDYWDESVSFTTGIMEDVEETDDRF